MGDLGDLPTQSCCNCLWFFFFVFVFVICYLLFVFCFLFLQQLNFGTRELFYAHDALILKSHANGLWTALTAPRSKSHQGVRRFIHIDGKLGSWGVGRGGGLRLNMHIGSGPSQAEEGPSQTEKSRAKRKRGQAERQ